MTFDDLKRLSKLAFDNGLPYFTITVALHIAAEKASDPDVIKSYGTFACGELQNLQKYIEATK